MTDLPPEMKSIHIVNQERGDRLRFAREAFGVAEAKAACQRFNWNYNTYNQHENGRRGMGRMAESYARSYHCSAGWLLTGEGDPPQRRAPRDDENVVRLRSRDGGRSVTNRQRTGGVTAVEFTRATLPYIPVAGKVAAGVWVEISMSGDRGSGFPRSDFPPDPRFSLEAQYDIEVEGSSLDRVARPGERLRCVDVAKTRVAVNDGDLVIVTRTRKSELCETTARRLRRRDGHTELWPESDDPRWQEPLLLTEGGAGADEVVAITAKVLYVYHKP